MKIQITIEFNHQIYGEQVEISNKTLKKSTLNLADTIRINIDDIINKIISNILKQSVNREKDEANID